MNTTRFPKKKIVCFKQINVGEFCVFLELQEIPKREYYSYSKFKSSFKNKLYLKT